MDLKLFFSTFALIFLAELGDKTQLAALASSAGSRSPWSVFAGAAAALVMSTLLAVVLGSTLQRLLPQHYLKGGAAILFFIFGTLLLINAVTTARGETTAVVGTAEQAKPGIFAHIALAAAREFEHATAMDYTALAASAQSESLRRLFQHLADEEKRHLDNITQVLEKHADARLDTTAPPSVCAPLPAADSDKAPLSQIIASALRHEYDTAQFYEALARSAPLPSVRTVLAGLAREERTHIAHIEEFVRSGIFEEHTA